MKPFTKNLNHLEPNLIWTDVWWPISPSHYFSQSIQTEVSPRDSLQHLSENLKHLEQRTELPITKPMLKEMNKKPKRNSINLRRVSEFWSIHFFFFPIVIHIAHYRRHSARSLTSVNESFTARIITRNYQSG